MLFVKMFALYSSNTKTIKVSLSMKYVVGLQAGASSDTKPGCGVVPTGVTCLVKATKQPIK